MEVMLNFILESLETLMEWEKQLVMGKLWDETYNYYFIILNIIQIRTHSLNVYKTVLSGWFQNLLLRLG